MIFKKIVISLVLIGSLFAGFSQSLDEETAFLKTTKLHVTEMDAELLEKCGLASRKMENLSLLDFDRIAEKSLKYLENHGYPFANVSLQPIMENDSTFKYYLKIDKNRFVRIDSIVLKGDAKIRQSFLWPYLGLRKKSAYSEKAVNNIGKKISSLTFVSEVQQPGISFVEDKTLLYLYLDKQRTNRFDGYIGFQPESSASGKLSITGEILLALQNIMRIGESISLLWRSTERHSQYLNLNTEFPYLFYTRFGIDAAFELDKRDTSFLNLNFNIGIPYKFRNDCTVRPFFGYSKSQPLSTRNSEELFYNDFKKTLYGLSLRYFDLDYIFNPQKGVDASLEAAAGVKTSTIKQEQSKAATTTKQTTFTLLCEVTGYIPIGKHFTIVLGMRAGSLLGNGHYINEMFKIGGKNFLRGFTQNELLASTYLTGLGEARYLFGRNSNVHIFFDGGIYERNVRESYLFDMPFGFGFGVDIGVRSGVFYFEYALPRQQGNNISLKTGKIHFGIKAMF